MIYPVSEKTCGAKMPFGNIRCQKKPHDDTEDHGSTKGGLWWWGKHGVVGGGHRAMVLAYGEESVASSRRAILHA